MPEYYITKEQAEHIGWVGRRGNLAKIAPGYMIFGGVYKNKDGILLYKENRIWYEADINYKKGYRNSERIVFSNDGLIFVTYDHYKNFIEIIAWE